MNTCIYRIQTISYTTKTKGKKGLPETDQEFKNMVWSKSKDHLDQYPLWFQQEFVQYWLTVPDCSTKNRYFLLPLKDRKRWSTLGRMATVKRLIYSKDPRWNSKPKGYKVQKTKNEYSDINYEKAKQRASEQSFNTLGEKLRLKFTS